VRVYCWEHHALSAQSIDAEKQRSSLYCNAHRDRTPYVGTVLSLKVPYSIFRRCEREGEKERRMPIGLRRLGLFDSPLDLHHAPFRHHDLPLPCSLCKTLARAVPTPQPTHLTHPASIVPSSPPDFSPLSRTLWLRTMSEQARSSSSTRAVTSPPRLPKRTTTSSSSVEVRSSPSFCSRARLWHHLGWGEQGRSGSSRNGRGCGRKEEKQSSRMAL
jgi:hypothetical protein